MFKQTNKNWRHGTESWAVNMDTASDNDSDEGSIGGNAGNELGMDLTGILFGNIDSEGKLMDDDDEKGHIFDAELRENLSSLSK